MIITCFVCKESFDNQNYNETQRHNKLCCPLKRRKYALNAMKEMQEEQDLLARQKIIQNEDFMNDNNVQKRKHSDVEGYLHQPREVAMGRSQLNMHVSAFDFNDNKMLHSAS